MHRKIFTKYRILIEKNGILAEIIPACTESIVLKITKNEKKYSNRSRKSKNRKRMAFSI
jgi:hypothetical protein